MNEVFLDTETTGLSFKDGHRIVEIACVDKEGYSKLDTDTTLKHLSKLS